ncbi:HET-domain-containing protein, partial [Dichomitus squalens LYAD-421 SS1]
MDTHTGQFIEQADPHVTIYATLSHTWDSEGEQTYRELQEIQRIYDPGGHRLSAINPTPTSMVSLDGFRYIWIDSCCIEKQSSSELSEAINSMYAWYRDSKLCYAFLADVSACGTTEDWKTQFSQSRWFRRGWTLQELIAPSEVVFLSQEWEPLGTKHDLAEAVEEITGIDQDVLKHELPLDCVSVAKRMSWASGRETTRVEDEAYSLLGIFDINMTMLYGEGRRAFRRLQEEILLRIPDQTLFAW